MCNEKLIYLDNAATTRPSAAALEAFHKAAADCWGNPSSLHSHGIEAEKRIAAAEKILLHEYAHDGDVIFTSGATESNNLAIFGTTGLRRGRRIVTTALEHPSVLEPLAVLEARGFEVVRVPPSDTLEDDILAAVTPDTVLVTVMSVNNETGQRIDTDRLYDRVQRAFPSCVFHTDAAQAFLKRPGRIKGDLVSVSAHKVHGFKGSGALFVKKGVRIAPLVHGGGQQKGLRSGTEAVELIAGLGAAAEAFPRDIGYIQDLHDYAVKLLQSLPSVKLNSPKHKSPYILSFSALGVRSEVMMHFLAESGVLVSSGSACARNKQSHVLKAMGLSPGEADSALRVSFSGENTRAELDRLAELLEAGIKRFRRGKLT